MRPAIVIVLAAVLASCATPSASRGPDVLAAVRGADVVFFGEGHDDRQHHAYELLLLETMTDGRPLLLGMEMFQRPWQEPLDQYVAGLIDEREMLRRTEYFTRWNFDYTFYAPLWRWCREHGVRVVALNAEASVIKRIRMGGLAGLPPEDRASVAADIDLGVAAHRARIDETYRRVGHPLTQPWYEAMTAWDETMAETASSALADAGPGARMLVVAGRGHCETTGIPDRLARRMPALRRAVVLGETTDEVPTPPVARSGDEFVVSFAPREEPPAPKLGIEYDTSERSLRGLKLLSVVPGGPSDAAGAKGGDVLVKLGGAWVLDITDLRYVLDASKTGDVVAAEIDRDGEKLALRITVAPPPAEPAPAAPAAAPKK
jgi:uncharacterized iron-regulated protein